MSINVINTSSNITVNNDTSTIGIINSVNFHTVGDGVTLEQVQQVVNNSLTNTNLNFTQEEW